MSSPCEQAESIAILKEHVGDMREDIKAIRGAILGNGHVGLRTQVALNKSSISRVWWGIGFVLLTVVSAVVKIVFYP